METEIKPYGRRKTLFSKAGQENPSSRRDYQWFRMITHKSQPASQFLIMSVLLVWALLRDDPGIKHGERVMKRVLSILAFLALSIPTAACAEWSLVRGSGNTASFESTARPTVAVKASPDFSSVAQGKMTVMLSTERELPLSVPGTVWYCLSAKEGAQLAVALADAGSIYWYPGIMSTNLEFLPVLYSCGGEVPGSVTQRVFIRPVHLDPWMKAFADRGMGWTAGVMVSQYEWIVNNGSAKLLVEYREPIASERCPIVENAELKAFVQRADTAFSARFGENGDIAADMVRPYEWGNFGVSPRLLSTVLGSTTDNPM